MPYVPPENRPSIDDLCHMMVAELKAHEPLARLGHLNYAITRIVMGALPEKKYHWLVAYRGVLADVSTEMYRRYVVPYEDRKIIENGDVPEYGGTE